MKVVHSITMTFLGLCLIDLSLLSHSNATGRNHMKSVWKQSSCGALGPGYTNNSTRSLDKHLAATSPASHLKKHTIDQKASPRMGLNEFYFRQPT